MSKKRKKQARKADQYTPIQVDFADTTQNSTVEKPYVVPTRDEFADGLFRRIDKAIQDRRAFSFDDNVRRFRRYYDLAVSPKQEPWKGCSNTAPYIGRAIVETIHAEMQTTIFGSRPWFRVEPDDPSDSDVAESIQDALQRQLSNVIKLQSVADDVIKAAIVDGTGVLFTPYVYEVDKTVRMERITGALCAELLGLGYDGGQKAGEQAGEQAQQQIQQLQAQQQAELAPMQQQSQDVSQQAIVSGTTAPDVAQVAIANQIQVTLAKQQDALQQAQQQAQQAVQQAQQQAAQQEDEQLFEIISQGVPQGMLPAIQKVFPDLSDDILSKLPLSEFQGKELGDWIPIHRSRDVVYDAPKVEHVDILDYVFYPASSKKQKTDIVECRRVYRSRDDLLKGVSSGIYDRECVVSLLSNLSQVSSTDEIVAGGDPQRSYRRGVNVYGEGLREDVPYMTYEGIARIDVDGDGFSETVYFELEHYTKELIRSEYAPWNHGHSPFDMIRPYKIPETQGRLGDSVFILMQHGIKLWKQVTDQRIDRGTLVNASPLAVDRRIKNDWAANPWKPGFMVKVDDPANAMVPMQIPDVTESSFANADRIIGEIRMAVGVSETQLQQAGGGGDTPASETDAIMHQVSKKMKVVADRIRDGFASAASKVMYLNQQFHPEMQAVQVQDDGTLKKVNLTPEQMMTGVNIAVHGTTESNNPQLAAQVAEKAFMMMERAGYTVDPIAKRRIVADCLRAYGQSDAEALLPSKQEVIAEKQQQKPQPSQKDSVAGKRDEIAQLTLDIKNQLYTKADYLEMTELARQAQEILLPRPLGADQSDATDQAAGYNQASQQAAAQGKAAGQS